jgi:hypothetical protein
VRLESVDSLIHEASELLVGVADPARKPFLSILILGTDHPAHDEEEDQGESDLMRKGLCDRNLESA